MQNKIILQLNATANWGSTGKIAEGIGIAAINRGWQSYIAYGRYMNPSKSQLIKVGKQMDVYAHYGISHFFDREGLGSKRVTRNLINQINELSPSIIHLHNIHDHWLNYPILFEYLATIPAPIVWTFHDCWAFTGGCAHFITYDCQKWKNHCENCIFRHNKIDHSKSNYELKTKAVEKIKKKLTIISVSQWLDSLVSNSLFKSCEHNYIYNGSDLSVFTPKPTSSLDNKYNIGNKIVILGVSNVWPSFKGLNDFIELRKILHDNYIIILVGLPTKSIRNLPAGIIGIERTTNTEELAALYTRADVVLSLSKAETFGMSLVEGLACGTPSIGYNITAIKEIIHPSIGLSVAPGCIEKIKEAIEKVTSNELINSETCRNRAKNHFDSVIQFNKYIDLYENLIKQQ